MEHKFNHEAVVAVLRELNEVKGINRFTVSNEAVEEITNLLKLDECADAEELRAIRNSVVMIYSAFSEYKYWLLISAITAVIDHKMVTKFHTL